MGRLVALVVLLLVLLSPSAKAETMIGQPWAQMVNFYSGGHGGTPLDFSVKADPIHGANALGGLSSNDANWASITPATLQQLQSWQASRMKSPTLQDVAALSFVIHEALHMRRDGPWNSPDWSTWPKGLPTSPSGLHPWNDEHQAQALGSQLVPDALQRYFGIKFNSPLGQKYLKLAQQAGAVYGYGVNPQDPWGPPNQQWQDLQHSIGDYSGYTLGSLAPSQPMPDITKYIVAHLK